MAAIATLHRRRARIWLHPAALLVMLVLPTPARAQTIEWIRQFGTLAPNSANGVAVDATGVYVVGSTDDALPGRISAGGVDAFVRKYDTTGNEIWTRQFGSPSDDRGIEVAVDASGVYVVGWTHGALPGQTSAGGDDPFVRKYDIHGREQWTRQFGSTGIRELPWGVGVDATGVYVAGETGGRLAGQTSAGGQDVFVRRYDPNGNVVWTRQFGSAGDDGATRLAVHSSGVYVVGWTGQVPGDFESGDAFVRKYDANGTEQWTRQFGAIGMDMARAVSVNATGVYVAGFTLNGLPGQTRIGSQDAFVRKYDASGNEQWTRQFSNAGHSGADAWAVAVDATGVYVAGEGVLLGHLHFGGYEVFVRKYDLNGAGLWTAQLRSYGDDWARGVAVDSAGVYVVGWTNGILGQTDDGYYDDAFVARLATTTSIPIVYDDGVINHASLIPRWFGVAPGSIAAVFGTNLNDGSALQLSSLGPDGKLATRLGETRVTINDIPAPIFYSTPELLAVQIPFELAGQTRATIQVTVGHQTSAPRTFTLDAYAPGIFTLNGQGTGAAIALHESSGALVTAQSPARPGEVVTLYATGLGAVRTALATGDPAGGNITVGVPTVFVAGKAAEMLVSRATPGLVGVYQVNIRIPASTRAAPDIGVWLQFDDWWDSNGVTIAVGP